MKHLTLLTLSLCVALPSVWADNTITTVEQVSEAVTLSDDVDYHITSATPFTATGSVNITNTEHATLVLDGLYPSLALEQLGYVYINGEPAKNGTNCQVKIYNSGAIIMPYAADIKPLTVYSEKDFGGESCNDFGLENTGGFMNTLTEAKLNNRIQSFKLKRGYMVTFSSRPGGYGYSRCFIADKADLEMNLPTVLAGRVSSYRIFKWNDCSKRGLASDTRTESNKAVNSQSCYDWAEGVNMGIDRECVANHIYEDWPSAAVCGATSYSPMMKTNNEPGNSADDHPQSVATVLANWEKLMATGKRLCSPTSHDGSLSWLREFIDSIDARGWRCDLMDVHCYWPEGSFDGLKNWYNSYGNRPLWISEWVWGASWNKNGVFTSGWEDSYRVSQNAVVVKRILDKLNSWGYVERYFYWNGEQWYSRIYNDGALTPTGEYYASMNTGVGYSKDYDKYIPSAPRMGAPSNLTGSFKQTQSTFTLKWNEPNGEYNNSMVIERQIDGGAWTVIAEIPVDDGPASYTYVDTVSTGGKQGYRIHTTTYNNKDYYSDVVYNVVSFAKALGADEQAGEIQVGEMTLADQNTAYSFFEKGYDEKPALIFGSVSNKNSKASLVEHLVSLTSVAGRKNSTFQMNLLSWSEGTTKDVPMTLSETVTYMAAKKGSGTIGDLRYEAGITAKRLAVGSSVAGSDTAVITFAQPFNDTPIVMASPGQYAVTVSPYPVITRVFDVTKEGFKVILLRQSGVTAKSVRSCDVSYVAIERGQTLDGSGHVVTVRDTTITFTSTLTNYKFFYGNDDLLANPKVLVQMQSYDVPCYSVLRTYGTGPSEYYHRVRLQTDDTNAEYGTVSSTKKYTERVGYIVVSDEDGSVTTGIRNVAATPATSAAEGIYDINGVRVGDSVTNLPKGIYVIKKDGKTHKFVNK